MNSTRKKITINATSAIIQVAFTAFLYFFLYKYLLNRLGVQQLSVWSLILSFSSIANLANLGLTSGLVKFVADYIAEKRDKKIGKLILTAFTQWVKGQYIQGDKYEQSLLEMKEKGLYK